MKTYRKKFRFEKDNLEYSFRLRKKIPWWILLIAVLVALLFIPLKKDVVVLAVNSTGEKVENATVTYRWRSDYVDRELVHPTDKDGVAVFMGIGYRPISIVLNFFKKAEAEALKDPLYGSKTVRFHWDNKILLTLTADLVIEVKDAVTREPVQGAKISLEVSDLEARSVTLTTESNGVAKYNVNHIDGVIDTLVVTAKGYSGTRLFSTPFAPDYHVTIFLERTRKCGETINNESNPKENDIIQYDMGQDNGVFRFLYYTEGVADLIEVYEGTSEDVQFGRAKLLFHFYDATKTREPKDFVDLTFNKREICVVYENHSTYWGYEIRCPR